MILYCDTLKYDHKDNPRFMRDVEHWIGKEIVLLGSEKYKDIYDVFDRTGWLIGVGGARCTTELKKNVRKKYQREADRLKIQIDEITEGSYVSALEGVSLMDASYEDVDT